MVRGRKIKFALLLSITPLFSSAETLQECLLENLKGVNDKHVAAMIRKACEEKTVPKKCRGKSKESQLVEGGKAEPDSSGKIDLDALEKTLRTRPRSPSPYDKCLEECKRAGYWSRHYGECSTD